MLGKAGKVAGQGIAGLVFIATLTMAIGGVVLFGICDAISFTTFWYTEGEGFSSYNVWGLLLAPITMWYHTFVMITSSWGHFWNGTGCSSPGAWSS